MELRVLKYFLTVAREDNSTRAADILHITQPALSRQPIELEQELDTTLFIRSKREITLTYEGHLFRQQAQEILNPIETSKYKCIRFSREERWGVLVQKNGPLAQSAGISGRDIASSPLIFPKREIVQNEILDWLGLKSVSVNVFATYNLLSNAVFFVEQRMGYAVCLDGAIGIRNNGKTRFVPLHPERITRGVLIWKKNHIPSPPISPFLESYNTFKA